MDISFGAKVPLTLKSTARERASDQQQEWLCHTEKILEI